MGRELLRHRRKLAGAALFILAAALPGVSLAQPFPSKPITLIGPYAAGGTVDIIARVIQEPLRKTLGQPIIVEVKPGASGLIATRYVARVPADGYTLLVQTNAIVITPHINKSAGVAPLQDFEPVGMIASAPMVLVTHPSLPVKSVRELIDFAKANPGKIDFGSSGPDSYGRLATEKFMREAGITMTHVPYKGMGAIVQALMTGEVKLMLSSTTPQASQLVKDGKLNMLGVAALEPSPLLPGVEPIARTLKGFEIELWYGLFAPRGTPNEVISKLHDALGEAVARPEVKTALELTGTAPTPLSRDQMRSRMEREYKEWGAVVKELGIKTE